MLFCRFSFCPDASLPASFSALNKGVKALQTFNRRFFRGLSPSCAGSTGTYKDSGIPFGISAVFL
jgi:hypothetical protein